MDRDYAALADCCPRCFPGDHQAVAPATVTQEAGGSVHARYQHDACGHVWDCWWSLESPWPAGEPQQIGPLVTGFIADLAARTGRAFPPAPDELKESA